ncbi:MAG: hypothetical protein Q8934_23065, partial [Bacillota bacterium]|nr:hypothetical protein [Bacillota bacterium]
MLVSIKNEFFQKNLNELNEYIRNLTNECSFICIKGLLETYQDNILLIKFEDFIHSIWIYRADGIAILVYLPKEEYEGFRYDFFNFTG